MGDKSPKAKQRDQKQKDAGKAERVAVAKSKQESQSQVPKFGKGVRDTFVLLRMAITHSFRRHVAYWVLIGLTALGLVGARSSSSN